eukprot:TRINITY_DN9713_c0_g1_i1.p3 TRINITY_DN9713_c0_g1~~TRINITY_DN9713_c0_g1_i1.p3  ORF type:complete len:198 (-),score=91.42 TRINITY_DN9713_c0_g1_i1:85-678(-)
MADETKTSDATQVTVPIIDTTETRSIPKIIFIEDPEKFIKTYGYTPVMNAMAELTQRYKYMDNNLARKKLSMKMKLPDIKKALEMVTFMKERGQVEKPEAVNVKFALTENMWANASIKNDTGKVCLWLGADTMVEYPYDEAIELLKKNMSNAEKYLESVEGDISFLKDQMTTTEVNMARIYNENIAIKQSANVSAKI